MKSVVLKKPISKISLYSQAIFSSLLKHETNNLPEISIELGQQAIDIQHLYRYQEVCGFTQTDQLPITYPHILAFPLHLQLLVDKSCPFPVIGLVHVRNSITQYQSLSASASLHIRCQFTDMRNVEKGIEIDIATYVSTAGECVWESVSTFLYRCKHQEAVLKSSHSFSSTNKKIAIVNIDHYIHLSSIDAKSDTGRKYGRVSHDINPIHLYPLTAKLFGFNTTIAHGMWSKAQVIAACEQQLPSFPYAIEVAFKQPLLLPNHADIRTFQTEHEHNLALTSENSKRLHLIATINKI